MMRIAVFLRDEAGASAAEYALILAILGAAIAVSSLTLGGAIASSTTHAATCMQTPSLANCSY